ncbi:polyribonucleotide nucleotidyltransferase [Sulfobacillus thermosulfidooxidans DSM 9293]|uniref:Polyribonucleotide nucleotidyltransferase n=2 Tax=Sulfobacillus thermosulfidooxidans TaxID=28034 RepID=A0A1W1WJW2_SULTA|nr:polyribonucleotide nucleotidyltransferase [Sulfobacillus thermosulfidooxidans]PSR27676.1 MAG: polyribonucleotide nucleotidyltransferase [Sulfobacillus thermosulfidooxidans]SMC06608.1 polyribonucleotide nucleotidyltransferase [Sulfobacillus thermosulfidooxidans DSM 9293]
MEAITTDFLVGGRTLTLETGKMARQANGSVVVRYGDTVVLVTVVSSREPKENYDFFPLTVDVEERLYAVGKIPGGYIKREGRPSESAILAARLTDRPIRPLFPEGLRNEVHVVVSILSVDYDHSPEICGMIGVSAALSISDIPFDGPIGAVQVGYVDGQFIINPTAEQEKKSDLKLMIAGTYDAILMIEAGANIVPESVMLDAILFGHEEIRRIIEGVRRFQEIAGKPKADYPLFLPSPELMAATRELAWDKLLEAMRNTDKQQRGADIEQVNKEITQMLLDRFPEEESMIATSLKKVLKEVVRHAIIHDGIRPDGRAFDEIRPISIEVGVLPRVHGTGLFTRGQTQALTAMTLGPLSDQQMLDGIGVEESRRYMHHYNFPPFATGEAGPMRGPNRRAIGHGALAGRALEPVIPSEEEFPYTLRLVSDILESNGSSSMASVCGSTLALMDGGVPISAPVAGIAMGLVKNDEGMVILTDIQGLEDALGDMDFKVAGTREGVTAIQMDIKIHGLDRQILETALQQAKKARLQILDMIEAVIPEPRKELSLHAPRILTMTIDPDKIRDVIGPGGKTINKIIESTKVGDKKVDIDIQDDGTIYIAAINQDVAQRVQKMIEDLTRSVQVGEVFEGRVTRIMNFGAFVEILPGKEGLVHISQLSYNRVNKVEDVVSVGDMLTVKVIEIDSAGRINLSHKDTLPVPEGYEPPKARSSHERERTSSHRSSSHGTPKRDSAK